MILNTPFNVVGNSSNISENKIDTSLLVQKPYLRTRYIEANIEEDISLKNQNRIKNLPDPLSIREAVSKNFVDDKFNDPSITKKTAHVEFDGINLNNFPFIKVNSIPNLEEHLAAKLYVCQTISIKVDESSKLRFEHHRKQYMNYQLNHMLIAYMKTVEKQVTNEQCLTIKIMMWIILN